MLNRVVLIGRLVRDPETATTAKGDPVARMRIAVDRNRRNAETNERETDFIDIVAWRNQAEFARKYLAKGRLVAVDGRLQVRTWTGQDGTRHVVTEVVAESVQGLDRPRESMSEDFAFEDEGGRRSAPSNVPPDEMGDVDEPDPFAE